MAPDLKSSATRRKTEAMTTWIAMLRAVNLGARNKVPMPALREALTDAGLGEVRTYVQSGNIAFTSRHRSPDAVASKVRDVVRREFDVDQPVLVRSIEQIETVIAGNPYPRAALDRPKLLHVTFLTSVPEPAGVQTVHSDPVSRDVCRIVGAHLYVDFAESVHGSRLSAQWITRRLGVDGTARNWRTVLALMDLAKDVPDAAPGGAATQRPAPPG